MNTITAPIEEAIRDLQTEINSAQLELDAKIRSLKVLENVLVRIAGNAGKKDSSLTLPTKSDIQDDNGIIDLQELDTGLADRKRTLIDDIRDIAPRFGTQEFTIAHVEGALKKLGIEVTGKFPRSRISVALVKLAEERVLIKTFTGIGNVPHRYRNRAGMSDGEIMNASTSAVVNAEANK